MSEPTSEERHEAIWAALRQSVCTVCLDRKDDGTCGASGHTCALEAHLPRILDVVASTRSSRMDEYVDAVRQRVCAVCEHEDDGTCRVRQNGECALNAYLPLVVEAIEDADRSLRERSVEG